MHKTGICTVYVISTGLKLEFKFKTAQNSKNLRIDGHTSFECQTRNYITCFDHICNHPHSKRTIHKNT